jgi:hypothetical protein
MLQPLRKKDSLVYLVGALSVIYLAFLLSSVQPGVFFDSDGAVKYIVVKQLTGGHGFKYIYLPQPQWVHQIWADGFFPMQPPFLYPSPEGYLFVFPPAFQIVSSFFYSWLGNPGLYIIPVLSTLLLWLSLVLLLKRCGVAPTRIAAGLFVLVFCSPLTIYGATYWEHMPAILLLFIGLVYVVRPPKAMAAALGMGLLSGLAAWFRPEAMMMDFLYGMAAAVLFFRERQRSSVAFAVGLAVGIGSFLLFNKIEFDSFFGVHSRQVLKYSVEDGVEVNSWKNLLAINRINIYYYLFALLVLPVVYVLARGKKKLALRAKLLIGIVLAFCVLTPFMVPNAGGRQWGARYFLPVVTVVVVALLLVEKEWNIFGGRKASPGSETRVEKGVGRWRYSYWLLAIVVLFAAISFKRNTYNGGVKTLYWDNHHRISPSMNFVQQQPGKVVVVAYPYIAMELGYIFDQRYFFLAPDDSSLRRLLPLLKARGVQEYTYIYDVRRPLVRPKMLTDTVARWPREQGDFEFRNYMIQ